MALKDSQGISWWSDFGFRCLLLGSLRAGWSRDVGIQNFNKISLRIDNSRMDY